MCWLDFSINKEYYSSLIMHDLQVYTPSNCTGSTILSMPLCNVAKLEIAKAATEPDTGYHSVKYETGTVN